jgi:hypothetical protein
MLLLASCKMRKIAKILSLCVFPDLVQVQVSWLKGLMCPEPRGVCDGRLLLGFEPKMQDPGGLAAGESHSIANHKSF